MTIVPSRRVMRVIARLNIGGPAIQAITLTKELERFGYQTRLVRGAEDPSEGNMDYLAAERDFVPTLIPEMRRDPGFGDFVALLRLVVLLWRDRPALVHTHAAKGGTLGRVATVVAFPVRRWRPIVIHTYHGHSLSGYFSGRTTSIYRLIEQLLARVSDVLLAVSEQVQDDLIELNVASPSQFRVMPLGFDLSPFTSDRDRSGRRSALRTAWRVHEGHIVLTLIARLVPIKRVDRFIEMAVRLAPDSRFRFVIVGDGELHGQLVASPAAVSLGQRLIWAGFRRDIADVCYASDVVMLTSDNEGTPVSLIEAQAAAVPVVSTDAGGVRAVVLDGRSGFVRATDDLPGLVESVRALADDPELRQRMALAGRRHVTTMYTLDRLVADHAELYDDLLTSRFAARQAR